MDERETDMTKEEFETMKKLILLQLGRVESAETLDEAKKLTQELIETLQD